MNDKNKQALDALEKLDHLVEAEVWDGDWSRDCQEFFTEGGAKYLIDNCRASLTAPQPEVITADELLKRLSKRGWYPHYNHIFLLGNIFPNGVIIKGDV